MDDQLLLSARSTAAVDGHMRRFRALGVDRVRVSAFWIQIAPRPTARTKPRGFDGSNPYQRTLYHWRALDRVVQSAAKHGLKVMISITTPAPHWATGRPSAGNPLWKPDPAEFRDFARAVATRYALGADQFAVLNEPNQAGWLQPQSERGSLYAPHHYRRLVRAAFPAIRAVDPDATVLIGELASGGTDRRGIKQPIRPLAFLRALGCVDRAYRPLRGGHCRGFAPARGDAVGHHPYAFFSRPSARSTHRDDAGIGDTGRLLSALDRLSARRALVPARGGRFPVHYTEFGYQTDPPDPFAGIPLARQDRYLQEAAFIAWRAPRVHTLNQFRLTDGRILSGGGPSAYREFQSGLMFRGGRRKPAYASFRHPFATARRGSRLLLWGQVRPGGAHTVTVERLSGGRWRELARLRTDARGYWTRTVSARAGRYRYRWGSGASRTTRTLRVDG